MNIFEGFYSILTTQVSPAHNIIICNQSAPVSFHSTVDFLCNSNNLYKWHTVAAMQNKKPKPDTGNTDEGRLAVTGVCRYNYSNTGAYRFSAVNTNKFVYINHAAEGSSK